LKSRSSKVAIWSLTNFCSSSNGLELAAVEQHAQAKVLASTRIVVPNKLGTVIIADFHFAYLACEIHSSLVSLSECNCPGWGPDNQQNQNIRTNLQHRKFILSCETPLQNRFPFGPPNSRWNSGRHRHLYLINYLSHARCCPCRVCCILNGLPRGGMSGERHFSARRID